MAVVFVNYRVREQPGYATLLHRELSSRFGGERVFMASHSVRAGDDFVERVFGTLRECEVVLAVIGPRWLEFFGEPEVDWVHRELREAFAAGVRVVPVLLEDAELPGVEQLPADIAALARCQYLRLRHYSFGVDLAQLVLELRRSVPALGYRVAKPTVTGTSVYRLAGKAGTACRIGVVPGSIRRVRTADVWVNSENTDMRMARHNDFSVSGIIRYWGSVRDGAGRVVDDLVADELDAIAAVRRPVAPGAVIVTGAGELTSTHNVHRVVHVAAVHGEPGAGYRQVRDIGWCVTNVLGEVERLGPELPSGTVLFPLLGTGVAGAEVRPTAEAMVTAAVDYLVGHPATRLRRVSFLGYSEAEHRALLEVLHAMPVVPDEPG